MCSFVNKKLKSHSGFTLIEALISILLLSITVVAGMSFYFRSDEVMTLVTHKRIAAQLAASRLEDIKKLARANFNALPEAPGPEGVVLENTDLTIGALEAKSSDGL